MRISGRKLVDIVRKVSLKAVLLFDDKRICIDTQLPRIKHPWASCHETGHRILYWHKPFFFGDTAETLEPDYQALLEDEANYAAGRLLFLGDLFIRDARDVSPTVEGLKVLAKRYDTSLTATLRRYVEARPNVANAMLVSTPPWAEQPKDQANRSRHFVPSALFSQLFPDVAAEELRVLLDGQARRRRGGLVAEFEFALLDGRRDSHEMVVWSFNNQHYLISLVQQKEKASPRANLVVRQPPDARPSRR